MYTHALLCSALLCSAVLWRQGMFAGQAVELKEEDISLFVNQGGFDMLGRSSEQIHTDDQVRSSLTPYRRPSLHTPYTPDGRHSLPLGVVCISATHGICVPSTAHSD
jgi:hypothetical protein